MKESSEHKCVLWKSSNLAYLFHKLRGWQEEDLKVNDVTQMTQAAEVMRAQLKEEDDEDED